MSLSLRFLDPLFARPARRHDEALLPAVNRSNLWEVVDAVNRLEDLFYNVDNGQLRRLRQDTGELTMKREQDGSLQLAIDVHGYKPEDLKIELVDDSLVVHAKNETSGENSFSKSEMKRWFKLPENCKVEDIKSSLTADNKLMISLPSNKPAVEQKRGQVPITIEKRPQVEDGKKQQSGDKK